MSWQMRPVTIGRYLSIYKMNALFSALLWPNNKRLARDCPHRDDSKCKSPYTAPYNTSKHAIQFCQSPYETDIDFYVACNKLSLGSHQIIKAKQIDAQWFTAKSIQPINNACLQWYICWFRVGAKSPRLVFYNCLENRHPSAIFPQHFALCFPIQNLIANFA